MSRQIKCYAMEGVFQTAKELGATSSGRRFDWIVQEDKIDFLQTIHFFLADGSEVGKWSEITGDVEVFDAPRVWSDGYKNYLDLMGII